MDNCVDHLNFCGAECEDCGSPVDQYGNTENQFDYCSYPNCGCDGERLCMAKNGASERSLRYNVEGMYRSNEPKARLSALGDILQIKEHDHDAQESRQIPRLAG